MRAGGFTMQQGLSLEASTIIKQAITLARRRGHAQVTPLHVAHTMLSTSSGLLRKACLRSHSHPLRCNALELCFNVALNRLPASSSSPMLGPHHQISHLPSISNALVAAFKRAQAHQRRGSVENQNQPLLVVKIELEQLIISILDDPSVSRVMREASFSSTQVKSNVEQIVSLEICSQKVDLDETSKSNPIRVSDDRGRNDDLSLSLNSSIKGKNDGNRPSRGLQLECEEEMTKKLTCCAECSTNFDMEARSLQNRGSVCNRDCTTSSSLPTWLQQYKNESKRFSPNQQDSTVQIRQLCKKWNSICSSIHHHQHLAYEKTLIFSSISPSSSTSEFSYDQRNPNNAIRVTNKIIEPSLTLCTSSNPNSTQNSSSSSDVMEIDQHMTRFKEFNPQNLQTLCNALEKKVPWQKDIIHEIATTTLRCRSEMVKRKEKWREVNDAIKEETWLFFEGVDVEGKGKIAKELARVIFGSHDNFISIRYSLKISRNEKNNGYIDRLVKAVSSNPHRVFLLEDIEKVDHCSQIGIKRGIESGRLTNSDGYEVLLCDAILILSSERLSSRLKENGDEVQETRSCVSFDLNISIDDERDEDYVIDDNGLLQSVDCRIIFDILKM